MSRGPKSVAGRRIAIKTSDRLEGCGDLQYLSVGMERADHLEAQRQTQRGVSHRHADGRTAREVCRDAERAGVIRRLSAERWRWLRRGRRDDRVHLLEAPRQLECRDVDAAIGGD